MSDDGILQRLLQAMQGATVPTPFGWLPAQRIPEMMPSREGFADVAGWPIDTAARLWRESDFNPPDVRDRIYQNPPMLGSDFLRGMLGGDPGPTPGRAWITPARSSNPRGGTPPDAMPATAPASVFNVLERESFWPSVLSAATRRGR